MRSVRHRRLPSGEGGGSRLTPLEGLSTAPGLASRRGVLGGSLGGGVVFEVVEVPLRERDLLSATGLPPRDPHGLPWERLAPIHRRKDRLEFGESRHPHELLPQGSPSAKTLCVPGGVLTERTNPDGLSQPFRE